MKFSSRTRGWSSTPNALSALVERRRAEGKETLDLTESNPTRCGFRYLDGPLLESFSNPANLTYSPDPKGLAAAREAIAAYYATKGARVSPDDVFLASSTSEAYSFLLRLVADPGDPVLVPAPSYPLFDYLVGLNDARSAPYRLDYDAARGWKIDVESLGVAFAAGPAAAIAVSPNNPTGNYLSPAEWVLLGKLASRHGTSLIVDEVFHDFAFSAPPFTCAAGSEAPTFVLSGISKVLGLPQMKLAWIVLAGPEKERREAARRLEVIADTYLSVSAPPQNALAMWLPRKDAVVSEITKRVSANRLLLETALRAGGARALPSEGGWYSVVETPEAKGSDEELALFALERHGVLTHPGFFYDFEGNCRLVVSLLPPRERFEMGAANLARAIAEWKGA